MSKWTEYPGEYPELDLSESCPLCGGPEPCAKRACLDALSAQADYWEAEANPAGEEGNKESGRHP